MAWSAKWPQATDLKKLPAGRSLNLEAGQASVSSGCGPICGKKRKDGAEDVWSRGECDKKYTLYAGPPGVYFT